MPDGHSRSRSMDVPLILILGISLLLRVTVFCYVWSEDPFRVMHPDSASYENTARALLHNGRFAVSPEEPEEPQIMRAPGYPACIALVYALCGEKTAAVILMQMVVSVCTIAVVYSLAKVLWRSEVAIIAALLYALDPLAFEYSQLLLTETLFTFLMTLAVYAGVCLALDRPARRGYAMLLGLTLSGATLVRPISYWLIAPILIGLLLVRRSYRWGWGEILACALLIFVPFAVLVGGWQVRNLRVSGCAQLSCVGGYNLLHFKAADIIALRDTIPYEEAREKAVKMVPDTGGLSRPEVYSLYGRVGMSVIRKHPFLFLRSFMNGAGKMMVVPGETGLLDYMGADADTRGCMGDMRRLSFGEYTEKWFVEKPGLFASFLLAACYLLFIYLCALYAVWKIVFSDRGVGPAHLFVWGVVLYFVIVSAALGASPRFRVPVMPFLALYAAEGLSGLIAWRRAK
jgi:4-amino-4-deoxy-L-arabinose transferase-like glycosyltransferase